MRKVIVAAFVTALIVVAGEVEAQTAASVNDEVGGLVDGGQLDSALTILKRALSTDSLNVGLLNYLSDIQKAKGQTQARRQTLERILRIQPRSIDARLKVAHDFFEFRQLDSAAQFADAALAQSNRRSAEAYYWLGRIHGEAGRPDSALVYYRWAWILLPDGDLF